MCIVEVVALRRRKLHYKKPVPRLLSAQTPLGQPPGRIPLPWEGKVGEGRRRGNKKEQK